MDPSFWHMDIGMPLLLVWAGDCMGVLLENLDLALQVVAVLNTLFGLVWAVHVMVPCMQHGAFDHALEPTPSDA